MDVDLTKSMWAERPDYRVDLLARRNRVTVRTDYLHRRAGHDDVIAETLHPLIVDEQDHGLAVYFPRGDVQMQHLEPSEHVTHCPFKGRATHWQLAGTDGPPVAWSYEEPFPEVARIAGFIAFYQDRVHVEIGQAPRIGDKP
jgi:uncharacterized protein (DUF427 family)